jgi:hypothetical protein
MVVHVVGGRLWLSLSAFYPFNFNVWWHLFNFLLFFVAFVV